MFYSTANKKTPADRLILEGWRAFPFPLKISVQNAADIVDRCCYTVQ